MLKRFLPLILTLLVIQTASAQVVKVEMSPQTLLPNDVADCKLIFTAQQNTYVSGITIFHPSEVQVVPSSFSGIGWIFSGESYEFPFTIKAEKSGIYTLTIYVNTLNGTVKQSLTVRVLDRMPDIVLDKTVLHLNEVNTVQFTVTFPLPISNVVVEPLFNSDPKIIYVQNGKGYFKFEPTKPEPLKFKICFYNGNNYHEVVRTLNVTYIESRGVLINVTPQYPITLMGDVDRINVEIANLRGDTIYSVNITASNCSKKVQIPMIKSGETAKAEFDFCSRNGGYKEIVVKVSYRDELNNVYQKIKMIKIKVLNETTLQFSGLEIKPSLEGLTVTGDVSNNGRTKVYNVFVTASTSEQTKTYYIDSLDPSDFDTFEFTFTNYSNTITLHVKWTNEIGEVFETSKVFKVPFHKVQAKSSVDYIPIVVSVVVLLFVLILIFLSWKRRR